MALSALDQALADIAALGERDRLRNARIAADPRLIRIKNFRTDAELAHGMAGALQVFTELANGTSARNARVSALVRARIGQLDGNHASVRKNLSRAAANRSFTARPIIASAFNGGVMLMAEG